jgi:electron transfer flavoprotein beta subunit
MEAEQSPRRILVAIKRVVDYNVRIRVKPDGSGVVLDGVKLSINPSDAIAIEKLRIKERGRVDEVVVATTGSADCQATPRNALAGAHAHCTVATRRWSPRCAGFPKLVEREQPFLVILGAATDDDNNQTGRCWRARNPRGHVCFKVESETAAKVTREVDAGLETRGAFFGHYH